MATFHLLWFCSCRARKKRGPHSSGRLSRFHPPCELGEQMIRADLTPAVPCGATLVSSATFGGTEVEGSLHWQPGRRRFSQLRSNFQTPFAKHSGSCFSQPCPLFVPTLAATEDQHRGPAHFPMGVTRVAVPMAAGSWMALGQGHRGCGLGAALSMMCPHCRVFVTGVLAPVTAQCAADPPQSCSSAWDRASGWKCVSMQSTSVFPLCLLARLLSFGCGLCSAASGTTAQPCSWAAGDTAAGWCGGGLLGIMQTWHVWDESAPPCYGQGPENS